MTDRKIVYPDSIPLESDILKTNKNAMLGVAELSRTVLGTSTLLDGFACTPNSPAALNVIVGAGRIYQLQNVDATDYGSILADTTHNTVKQGQFWDAVTLSTPAPATAGFSVVYLVQIALQEIDSTPVVLPYYNAANPSVAYSGPGNTGVAQNTERLCRAVVSIKTGVAATTGTQATPAADAGYTGAWAITVANGQTTVTSPNIVALTTAPFITETLTQKAGITSVQKGAYTYSDCGGTTTAYTATLSPAPTTLTDGMVIWVDYAAVGTNTTTTPTLNVNGLGAVAITLNGGAAVRVGDIPKYAQYAYNSATPAWILINPLNSGRLLNIQVITSTQTYTATTGTQFVDVVLVGGGASGGGSPNPSAGWASAGGGGGAGGTVRKRITTGFNGVTVTIGAGGTAPSVGVAGNNGGNSSFGAIMTAGGGIGGGLGTQYNTPQVCSTAAAGGSATGGDINIAGGSGTSGTIFSTTSTSNLSGIGGASMFGFGGGQVGGTTSGGTGTGYGSGGGGGASVNAGGATQGGVGKAGICIIYEYGY